MLQLLASIKNCNVCERFLAAGVNPVVSASENSRIAIIGQAPGRIVHQTSIPWNDKSGEKLREWLDVDSKLFYNPELFALMPMGFCYPGTGKSGDLPPRPECAPLWHQALLNKMPHLKMIVLLGQYAQNHYLKEMKQENLTENVRNFTKYLPFYFPLPHPSPRNNLWLAKNPWFKEAVLTELKLKIHQILFGN